MLDKKYDFARGTLCACMIRLSIATRDGLVSWRADEEDSDCVLCSNSDGVELRLFYDGSFNIEQGGEELFSCEGVNEGRILFDKVCSLLYKEDIENVESFFESICGPLPEAAC